jgi:hypothetical protein
MSQHFYIPTVILEKPSFPISVRWGMLRWHPFNGRDAVLEVYPLIFVAESKKITFNEKHILRIWIQLRIRLLS